MMDTPQFVVLRNRKKFGNFGFSNSMILSGFLWRVFAALVIVENASSSSSVDLHKALWKLKWSLPGNPLYDYPIYSQVPHTSFQCEGKVPGYYADPQTACQAFHVCHPDTSRSTYLCPNGTLYDMTTLGCNWWYKVYCFPSSLSSSENQPPNSWGYTYPPHRERSDTLQEPYNAEQYHEFHKGYASDYPGDSRRPSFTMKPLPRGGRQYPPTSQPFRNLQSYREDRVIPNSHSYQYRAQAPNPPGEFIPNSHQSVELVPPEPRTQLHRPVMPSGMISHDQAPLGKASLKPILPTTIRPANFIQIRQWIQGSSQSPWTPLIDGRARTSEPFYVSLADRTTTTSPNDKKPVVNFVKGQASIPVSPLSKFPMYSQMLPSSTEIPEELSTVGYPDGMRTVEDVRQRILSQTSPMTEPLSTTTPMTSTTSSTTSIPPTTSRTDIQDLHAELLRMMRLLQELRLANRSAIPKPMMMSKVEIVSENAPAMEPESLDAYKSSGDSKKQGQSTEATARTSSTPNPTEGSTMPNSNPRFSIRPRNDHNSQFWIDRNFRNTDVPMQSSSSEAFDLTTAE